MPFTLKSPAGMSLSSENDFLYYTSPDGKLGRISTLELLTPQEQASAGANAKAMALDRLQSQYGVDYASLTRVNPADQDRLAASMNGYGSNGVAQYDTSISFQQVMSNLNTPASGPGISQTYNTDPAIAGYVNPNAALQVPSGQNPQGGTAGLAPTTTPQPFGSNYGPLGVPNTVQPGVTPIGSIGSGSLGASTTTQTYQNANVLPIAAPPTGSYTAPPTLQATPQETKQSDLITQLQTLNDEYAGKATYQNQQNEAAGVNAKQAVVNSLTAQRQQILNEATQIQLQVQQGQGVTTAVDQRQRNEALRVNAIAELSISSLMAAANGDLANAQILANKAVAAKFDPILAKIDAGYANLELIKNDPETSRQDLNRANEAQAKLDAQKQATDQAIANAETIFGIATSAAANGADALTLQQIQNAGSPQAALQIAAQKGFAQNQGSQPASVQEYQFAQQNGYTGSFTQYQNEDANRKKSIAAAGVAGSDLTNADRTAFNSIVAKYNASPLILAADRSIVLKNTIDQVKATPTNGALQLNLVYSYIQALDTYQSAVREGELSLVNSIDSKTGKIANYVQQIQNGQIVRPEVAIEIANAAEALVNTISAGAASKAKSYEAQADAVGLGATWDKYQAGYKASYNTPTATGGGTSSTNPLGI